MSGAIEDPGAEVIAAIVGEAPLALPESIDSPELEEDDVCCVPDAPVSGKRGGKV